MPDRLDAHLRRLRRKLILAAWLGRSARFVAAGLAVTGVAVLLARGVLERPVHEAAWLLLPAALGPLLAWRGVRRAALTREGAAAWLDLHAGAAGWLLLDHELGDERWRGRFEEALDRLPEPPALRVGPLARPLLAAGAFALVTLLLPLEPEPPGASRVFFERALEDVARGVETLARTAPLEPVVEEELRRRAEDLAQTLDPDRPEAALEAIDALRADLGLEGQRSGEQLLALAEEFAAIAGEAGAGSPLARELFEARFGELARSVDLEALAREAAPLVPQLASALGAVNGGRLPEGLELSPEQLEALSRLAGEALRGRLGELGLAGLADLAALRPGDPRDVLARLVETFHRHDESCKEPGGT